MIQMAIGDFNAHALKFIMDVAKTREGIIITQDGKPLAQILPFVKEVADHKPGQLAHTLVYEKDIVTPLGDTDWEVCQ